AVINVTVTTCAGDTVLLVKVVIQVGRGVVGHVAVGIILIISSWAVNPVMGVGGQAQIFRAALSNHLPEQISPGIVGVVVAPVFGFVVDRQGGAVCPGILGGGQPVK